MLEWKAGEVKWRAAPAAPHSSERAALVTMIEVEIKKPCDPSKEEMPEATAEDSEHNDPLRASQ